MICELSLFCSNDVAEKVDEMSVESDEDDRVQPMSKFGLLNIEDASGSDSEPDSDTVSTATKQTKNKKQTAAVKVDDKMANKGAAKKQGSKGKADTKKSKDEDDIDELLAQLDAPKSVKSGDKKEKKKKKGGNVEDVVVSQADTSTQPATDEPEIDYRNMTQEEIAKLMEEQYGEDSEEERKKAKGKKKMRRARETENGEVETMSGKASTQVRKDEEKNADADADVEIADNVPKPTKKQNKKTQRKDTKVFAVYFICYCLEYYNSYCSTSILSVDELEVAV